MNDFSKMYLLSPESYNRIILEKMAHQGLDREMYNIIANKKIQDAEKWYLYRQILVKFACNLVDASSQTNRIPKPIHDKDVQANVESHAISIQTDPIIDEFSFSPRSINEEYLDSDKSKESDEEIWSPTARSKPKTVNKKLTYPEDRRKSLNDSVISVSSGSALASARQLLKAKKAPLIRSSTIPGLNRPSQTTTPKAKQSTQTRLNFRVKKVATPRLTRATSKTQGSQDGGKRFKWTCMR